MRTLVKVNKQRQGITLSLKIIVHTAKYLNSFWEVEESECGDGFVHLKVEQLFEPAVKEVIYCLNELIGEAKA